MNFNFKKTVIASLFLVSSITYAQTSETPVVSFDKKEPSCECGSKPIAIKKTTVKKAVVKRHVAKRVVKAPTKEITMLSQGNIVEEVQVKPIPLVYSYNDVHIVPTVVAGEKTGWFSKTNPKIVLNAVGMDGQPYPMENFVYNNGNNLTLIQLATDLKSSATVELSTNSVYEPLNTVKGCQAYFVKYQLIGNKDFKVEKFFLNNNGQIESSLPADCAILVKDERNNTDYTNKKYIVDLSWTRSVSVSNKPFEFNMHLTKQGHDYFAQNLNAYIVDTSFEHIYFPKIIQHRKGPYFGTNMTHNPLASGSYNVIMDYDVPEGHETVVAIRSVQ